MAGEDVEINPPSPTGRREVHLESDRRLPYDKRCHHARADREVLRFRRCTAGALRPPLISQSPLPVSTWHDDEGTVYGTAVSPRLLPVTAI